MNILGLSKQNCISFFGNVKQATPSTQNKTCFQKHKNRVAVHVIARWFLIRTKSLTDFNELDDVLKFFH